MYMTAVTLDYFIFFYTALHTVHDCELVLLSLVSHQTIQNMTLDPRPKLLRHRATCQSFMSHQWGVLPRPSPRATSLRLGPTFGIFLNAYLLF